MAQLLDTIMQLQSQGISDTEIIKKLREQNASPKDINDALNQAKVKQAVNEQEQELPPYNPEQNPQEYYQQEQYPSQDMQQSIMQPQPQEQYAPQPTQQLAPQQGQYYPQTPQAYPQEAYYPQQGLDTDTITEIAEQVVSEKFSEFRQKTGDLVSFKNDAQDRLKDLDERLKRIENSLDKIQQAIIGKIGEFGESTASIHQDLENLHESFSKLANPLIDNYKELRKIAGKK